MEKLELELHTKQFLQRHEQRTQRFVVEAKQRYTLDLESSKCRFHLITQSESERSLQEVSTLKKKNLEREYQLNVSSQEELFALHTENIQSMHPLEITDLKQMQEMEAIHLSKQQKFEYEQQQDLLLKDHKSALRDFNTKKALDEKRLLGVVKEYKKDNRKKLTKAQLDSYGVTQKVEWDKMWAEKLTSFLKEQKEQKDEEEKMLKAHHMSQTDAAKTKADEQITNLITAYENEKNSNYDET